MNKIHLIGNAHIDIVWLWQWQEGYMEVKSTFRSALDRMKEFDDFKFTSACSAYYMWIEECDYEMFEEIKERVKEGRWNIVGGWYLQPDCNMPSGESFARHALISQRYFKEKFGIMAKTGYNVDSFGHNGNLPQILKKSGMNNYIFMRPMPHEKELPSELFEWRSMDGSAVMTYRIPQFYNIDLNHTDVFNYVKNISKSHEMMAFYGVGNHGGGATIELLDWMKKNLDEQYIYSTPDEYFNSTKDNNLPVVYDDLQFHAKGCYSAYSKIKADNRKAECMLYEAESFSVLSFELLHTQYPAIDLRRSWRDVMFNQFHDILCGCAIEEAYSDAAMLHGESMSISARITNFALHQISWNIDTMHGKELIPYKISWPPSASWKSKENIGTPIVVFNSLAYPMNTIASVHDIPNYMTDDMDNVIPIQMVRDSKTNADDKYKIVFCANVPALGYSVYRMYFEGNKPMPKTAVYAKGDCIGNDLVKAEFDSTTGELKAIINKKTGMNLLTGHSSTILVDEEHCDTWAHDISNFKKLCQYSCNGRIHIIENGPIRATMRAEQLLGGTHIVRDYSIKLNSDEITVKTKIDFHERHKMLKFVSSINLFEPKSMCEIPFGFISRPNDGGEQVSGSWVALTGETCGLGIATDSKYSFDAEDNNLSLTVLRGAVYADHFGQNTRDEFCEYMDQGIHKFVYSIFQFNNPSDATKRAQKLNHEPLVIAETFHKGSLDTKYSGLWISDDNIVVTAIKKHEDSDGIILRLYEADNIKTKTKIIIFGLEFETSFGQNEIKTFLIKNGIVSEVDFLEYESL